MFIIGHEVIPDLVGWARLAADAGSLRLLVILFLLWSLVSILLVAGLGAWIATMRAWRERR